MTCTLSLVVLALAAASAPPAMAAAVPSNTVRAATSGPRVSGPVGISLQNEMDAAVDRGRAWLAAAQQTDGSWSATNRLATTAVAALALARSTATDERAALRRAARWLAAADTDPANAEVAAWHAMALAIVTTSSVTRSVVLLSMARQVSADHDPFAWLILREALGPAALPTPQVPPAATLTNAAALLRACVQIMPAGAAAPAPAAAAVLSALAAHWQAAGVPLDPAFSVTRQMWLYARVINRAGGGTLADATGRVVDWRNDLARALVATQQIDASGRGGFWSCKRPSPDWAADTVAKTAFALLALEEL